ncbi:MAG: bifunctional UDP-N-acetylglucosamine diphosphorylase/glucosamine-1-phosphate N-acetyltransferase GlmU [Aggregatilineales bacterium]|nr:bifunctional UDP-N-acetylglucosamine diphosphorylase/glucosamine-1-phosphate N-acetyltransferase GlmU [Aggregatilineales bacterium]HPV07336.1 bifunctional UDP-N-acetylglucosamine diphosphorylase/glucosamine-1-phosphate N-acetyltransferase GlmU [Aggregatilineales bacterium]
MSLDVIILAAGQGTRMKSNLPKVLHPLGGQPLVLYSVQAAEAASGRAPVLVIGNGADQVRETVGDAARYVLQAEQLGTGHAVMQARPLLEGTSDYVVVMYADMPLLTADTLRGLYEAQQVSNGPITMLTHVTDTPRGFGRIVRDPASGSVRAIVEEAQATPEQLAIREVNVGVYCFDAAWLWSHLDRIPLSPEGEYYLTDLVEMAVAEGHTITALTTEDADEVLGINTRVHLAEAEAALRRRVNERLMLAGVTIVDPASTYIHPTVEIGQDTVIMPNTYVWGRTTIGANCVIGPNTIIQDCTIGNDCEVLASVLEHATLEDRVDIGPFGHLRKGAYLESDVHMGNFGEVKNSRLRRGVKMGHFSYIGDGDIGEGTNIGAGTITCNYDGVRKHKTVIGKGVFIGSDTMLVAPLTLGDGARTGAGSVVTRDVPPGTLVYGVPARAPAREPQETTEDERSTS